MLLLESTSIRIEPLEEESITQPYINSLNDSEYMRYTRHARVVATYDTQREYLTQFNKFDAWILKITNLVDGSFVGTLNFYLDFNNRTINLGFLIFKEYQGRGFASQALNLLIEYLEKEFPRFKLVIGTKRSNLQMCRVALAAGFKPVKDLDQGLEEDCFYFRNTPEIEESANPEIPLILKSAKSIGVAANDAGGAEQLVWLIKKLGCIFIALLQGPAISIFENSGVEFRSAHSVKDLIECDLVLTGSGWMTNFENRTIQICKNAGVPTLTILDHWVNYQARFEGDSPVKPDLFVVTNGKALSLANNTFPYSSVWLLPDSQIEYYKTSISEMKVGDKVLVLLEPTSILLSSFAISTEANFDLIEEALRINDRLRLSGVVLRLHPSQNMDNLEIMLILKRFPKIKLSNNGVLVNDLRISSVVVGFSTYALYISAMCGLDTRSYFKNHVGHWTNLFNDITDLEIQ